jgi:hypothetical protein
MSKTLIPPSQFTSPKSHSDSFLPTRGSDQKSSPSGDKTIGAGSTIMHGASANGSGDAGGVSDGTAKTNVLIKAASQAGNFVDIVCDGSLYYVSGTQGQNSATLFS